MPAPRRPRKKAEPPAVPRPLAPRLLPLISELYIVTKDSEIARLGDVITDQQLDFVERCQHQLDTRGQIRMVVLKARQIGISTIIEAIAFVLGMLRMRFKALIVSHERDSSEHILGMTRTYWDTFVFQDFYTPQFTSRMRLSWTNGSGLHIATAKNLGAGRSRTLQFLHASEVAFWPNAETLMTGLTKSIPAFGLNCIFLESTANGVGNYFHRRCNAAMKGESDFEFAFYPWFEHPDYTIERLAPDLRKKYSLLGKLDPEERYLRTQLGVSDERLLWRRWSIANECEGDVNKFHQEMPSTPHEAFIATGRNVFSWPKLRAHYEPVPYQRGKLMRLRGRIKFVEDDQGPLWVYRWPSDDRQWGVYLIGGDPTHAPGGDNACMQVINRRTLEVVATYRRQIDPISFGKDMQMLGQFYNKAMLAPEATGPGYATIGCIIADAYDGPVYLRQKIEKMQGIPVTDLAGWTTNVETKELAIAHLVKLISEPLAVYGGETHGLVIHDPATLIEMRDYVTVEKGLGYANSDGSEYDDGVMALAIAAAVHAIEPKPPAYEFADMPAMTRPGPIRQGDHGTANPVPRDRPVEPAPGVVEVDDRPAPWEGIEHWAVDAPEDWNP